MERPEEVPAPLSASMENYLRVLFLLERTHGAVRSVDLARAMGFSKASVSVAVKKLCRQGLTAVEAGGDLALTPSGFAAAEAVYERYCFFVRKLTELGVPPELAHADACRLGHAVSAESFAALRRGVVGNA